MTEKRYYAHKHLLQENQVHDKICHKFMNIDETVEHMNNQYWKYKQLKEENEQLKKQLADVRKENYGNIDGINYYQEENASLGERISDLECENERLKKQIERICDDIDLALGFIRHKGYSLQDIKDYEDAKNEYEEDLKAYRKGDMDD